MKRLLNMAVSQVHFKCNETWYVQKDGLAMGASLAVIIANHWLKQHETALSRDIPEMFLPEKDLHGICPECNKEVTYRSKGVECESCLNWYHVKCGDISDDEYRNISETVWYCRKCIAIREKNKSGQQAKLFLRYVDDIVRTVKGDPEKVLRAANLVHPNLQFTIETQNTNGTLTFLDLQISIYKSRKISCGWYQKPTDTGTILNFRSFAPLQYKRSVIEAGMSNTRIFWYSLFAAAQLFDIRLRPNSALTIRIRLRPNVTTRTTIRIFGYFLKSIEHSIFQLELAGTCVIM